MIFDFLTPVVKPMAYLDPGSGSILIQMLVAAALGGAYLVKVYWKKLKRLFTGKKDEPVEQVEETEETPEQK